jgi:hypothetical protein
MSPSSGKSNYQQSTFDQACDLSDAEEARRVELDE